MSRRRPLLSALALSTLVLGGCFELTSSSTVDEDPAPYRPNDRTSGHWSDSGNTTNPLVVLGHEFRAATIQNGYSDKGDACVIYATVEFSAPRSEILRFQAKITMSNGAWVKSPIFFNDSAGNREFTFNYDTSRDGCWGATHHSASNLHVAACRGAGCDPGLQ
jgi:hypothetical protein